MFDRKYLADDFRAGVVVFLVALPLCLGIALASGAPLFSGLISGIAGGIVVTLISHSRHGVSGPAAGLAVMVAAGIETLGLEAYLLAVIVCGVAQVVAGFLRAGVIAHYFPSSVIKGMLAGIGIILILKQVPHALGYDQSWEGELEFLQRDGHNTFSEIGYALRALSPGATIVSAASLGILLLWQYPGFKNRRIAKALPAPLLVVLLGIGLSKAFNAFFPQLAIATEHFVSVPLSSSVGEFLSNFIRPDFSQITNPEVYVIGLTLALIASVETLLSVEATDNLDPEKRVTPTNKELKAQGVGNIVSGLLGGIPLTQVIVRSTANIDSGGKTRLASLIHGILLLLWAAERFPNAQILAVSNSRIQRAFIEERAAERSLTNLRVQTADINDFDPDRSFDRVVSIEMMEHVRNHQALFERIAHWLTPGGLAFAHIFCHRSHAYTYEQNDPSDWMAKNFFTGGMMPSETMFRRYQEHLALRRQWRVDGRHYHKTCDAWLSRLDRHRDPALRVLADGYGAEASQWLHRWRLFFIACSELFAYRGGTEWFVSHYLWEKR